jgi:hypothetical protein
MRAMPSPPTATAQTAEPLIESQDSPATKEPASGAESPKEIGGRDGPEPTRFGDWEKSGRCIDF